MNKKLKFLINDSREFKKSKIVNMNVDRFLNYWNRINDNFYSHATIRNYKNSERDWESVLSYVEDIKEGVRFKPPYLKKSSDLRFFRIDGTHRAIACELLGIEKIPVEVCLED